MNAIDQAQETLHLARLEHSAKTAALEEAVYQIAKAARLTAEWHAAQPTVADRAPTFIGGNDGLTVDGKHANLQMRPPPSAAEVARLQGEAEQSAARLRTVEAAQTAALEKGPAPLAKLAAGDMRAGRPLTLFGGRYSKGDRVPAEITNRLNHRQLRQLREQGNLR